jgi:putative membrane protein
MADPLGSWQPHPDAWVLVLLLGGGYLYALAIWGHRYAPGQRATTRRQRRWFLAGLAVLWLGADWPIHHVADTLFSVHMLQHMLFSLVAAPLLILGMPGWLLRKLLAPKPVLATFRFLTQPVIALLLFNGWVAAYHWPVLVNLSVHNDLVHFVTHVVWVVTAVIMWWPVLSPLPELPHLSYPARGAYLFAQSLVPTVPASFLTFSHTTIYSAYATAPSLWWGISPLADQQWAGLLMKIGGGLLLWGVIAVLFFRWAKEEETGGPDFLYWRDLEPELQQSTLGTTSGEPTGEA